MSPLLLAMTTLLLCAGAMAQTNKETLIKSGDSWKYFATGETPASINWRGADAFDDANWIEGASPLGYGGDGEVTTVPYGPNPSSKYITTYFRKTLRIADAAGSFSFRYKRDDGIVLYINGQEVKRENLPTAAITNSTLATTVSEQEEPLWKTVDVPNGLLKAGDNVIAAEIHQSSAGSSDIRFDVELWRTTAFQRSISAIVRTLTNAAPPPQAPSSQTFVKTGQSWKYYVATAAPPPTWKGCPTCSDGGLFDETGWSSGPSPLGYPDGPETGLETGGTRKGTLVKQCPTSFTCVNKDTTTYFRLKVTLADATGSFFMRYKLDDGIVIYVNGREVKRHNLPALPAVITYGTHATVNDVEEDWQTLNNVPYLHEGENVLAVEIHQSLPSSDIRFDLELWRTAGASIALALGPYLQRYSDDPALVIAPGKRSMTIRWSTNTASDGRVLYKPKTSAGSPVTTAWQSSTALTFEAGDPNPPTTIHNVSVTLTNLEPDTPYSYTIQSGSFWQGDAANYFVTAPVIGSQKKTRLWVLGDFGNKPDQYRNPDKDQINVRDAFNRYVKANGADTYVDLWLWLGDNAYDWGRDWEFQQSVFDVYDGRKDIDRGDSPQWIMKQTPIFATPGNHEYRNNQDRNPTTGAYGDARKDHRLNHYYAVVNAMTAGDAAGRHSRKEEYYSFDHANIHFVSLDTYGYEECVKNANSTFTCPYGIFDPASRQLAWLKEDLALAQSNAKIQWIIVFLHYPPYTKGSHDSDVRSTDPVTQAVRDEEIFAVRQKLLPVLENYRVDLVLAGHSHVYERSWPIRTHTGLSTTFNRTTMAAPLAAGIQASGLYDCSASDSSYVYAKSASAPNYIVHVVNGSGGGIERAPDNINHPAMQNTQDDGGSMYMEIEGDRLDAKFIAQDGTIKDQFSIVKASTHAPFTVHETDGAVHKADCECDDASGYTHYVERTPSGSNNLLLSIKKLTNPNGSKVSIGRVGDGTFTLQVKGTAGATQVNRNGTANYVTDTDWVVVNRHWTLTPTHELTNPVPVRFYYHEFDLWGFRGFRPPYSYNVGGPFRPGPGGVSHLNPAAGGNHLDMKVFKVNNDATTSYSADPASGGHANLPKATSLSATGLWLYPASGWRPIAEYWQNSVEFTVGRLKGGGGLAGRQSWAVSLSTPQTESLETPTPDETPTTLYPNPSTLGRVFFRPALLYDSYQLTDLQGRLLKQVKQAGRLEHLDISQYPSGLYLLTSESRTKIRQFRILKN
ncbi:metallophosphoesterase [Spirosoma arcticum]